MHTDANLMLISECGVAAGVGAIRGPPRAAIAARSASARDGGASARGGNG
jgi:hypothetical protein